MGRLNRYLGSKMDRICRMGEGSIKDDFTGFFFAYLDRMSVTELGKFRSLVCTWYVVGGFEKLKSCKMRIRDLELRLDASGGDREKISHL